MHFQTLLVLAFASATLALPATGTRAAEKARDLLIIAKAAPAAAASTGSPGATASNGTACSAIVNALAAGIQSNIDDQQNELTTVTALGDILAQNPMDMTLYSAAQSSLLGFVTKGIVIRENNQKLAPANNAAVAGLAVVAQAQVEELNLTMSLAVPASGAVDQASGLTTVATLKKDFTGGIAKNKENLAAATQGCTPANAAGSNSTMTR